MKRKQIIDLIRKQSEIFYGDKALDHHLVYGGMHPIEAIVKVEIRRTKSEIAQENRSAIRRYQRRNNISGLEWNTIHYCGHQVVMPSIHEELSPTKQDVQLLRSHKVPLLNFLERVQPYFKAWLWNECSERNQYPWIELDWTIARRELSDCDWLQVKFHDYIAKVLSSQGEYDRPEVRFEIRAYGQPPTMPTENSSPVWIHLSNTHPSW